MKKNKLIKEKKDSKKTAKKASTNKASTNMMNKDLKDIFKGDLDPKSVLIAILVILVLGAYSYFALYPKFQSVMATKDAIKSEEQKLNSYQEKITMIPALEDKLNEATIELDKKSENLSHNMEDGMFLIGLNKKMAEYNVSLVKFKIDEPKHYENFYAVPTTLKVRGDYRKVRELMYYLEEQKNITQILDYTMENYVEEKEGEKGLGSNAVNETVAVHLPATQVAYFNEKQTMHHLYKDCPIINKNEPIIETTVGETTKNPCFDCLKRYNAEKNGGVQDTQPGIGEQPDKQVKKATGIIDVQFKFIMYTKENPTKILDISDPASWKTGKFNPFTSSIK